MELCFFSSVDLAFFSLFKQVPLVHIMSLSQNRIPSPLVQVHVESLCEPGELCQDHLRMTLAYGRTTQRMLIPIWVNAVHFCLQ